MKVLAVDPGDKRIGLAVSDPTGTLARPLSILKHISRPENARRIAETAAQEGASLIVVGQPLNSMGEVGPQARKSIRLADAIRAAGDCRVVLWDETGTTQAAQQSRIRLGVSRKKRKGHLDDLAASILLQDYLNENEALVKGQENNDG
ncbi:Holliday junction resolvase RuvX [bacterium]|nr:Holliday junction resolvase RuvX [bacterium]